MDCFQGENGLSPLSILSTPGNVYLYKISFSRCEEKPLHSTPLIATGTSLSHKIPHYPISTTLMVRLLAVILHYQIYYNRITPDETINL